MEDTRLMVYKKNTYHLLQILNSFLKLCQIKKDLQNLILRYTKMMQDYIMIKNFHIKIIIFQLCFVYLN